MNRYQAPGATVKGLDVSHYDAKIDFSQVKGAGFEFVFAKCTEGVSSVDQFYAQNKQKAKAAGLLFGAYHFFRPGQDAGIQAQNFLKHAQLEKGDLQPVLDWETTHIPTTDVQRAQIWLGEVEKSCGKKPIIYGGAYTLNPLKLKDSFKEYPLWLAAYGSKNPFLPAPWTHFSFHQFTDKGNVPGIPATDEDMDYFNGSLDQLKKMVI